MLLKLVYIIPIMSQFVATGTSTNKIEPTLQHKFKTLSPKTTFNVLISFNVSASHVLKTFATKSFPDRGSRITAIVKSLKSHATQQQEELIKLLIAKKIKYTVFWSTNQVYVLDANSTLTHEIALLSSVTRIKESKKVKVPSLPVRVSQSPQGETRADWNIDEISAPEAWELPGGNNGTGVRIGVIASGALASHVILRDRYVGDRYGWFDALDAASQTPIDERGFGTHFLGTIVGGNGIGVAPGASWMACRAFNSDTISEADLIACGQWMCCPTLADGSEADCDQAPHVVLGMWFRGRQDDDFYDETINYWHVANIIPVFGVGDMIPIPDEVCGTVVSPADSVADVIAVGATSLTSNLLAPFSSRGDNSQLNLVKPDLVAPGVNIRSAFTNRGDVGYAFLDSTLSAAAHVAGVVALMKGYNPDIRFAQVLSSLTSNCRTVYNWDTGRNCGNFVETAFPNNAYGYGTVNARDVMNALIPPIISTIPPTISTDASSSVSTTEESSSVPTTEESSSVPTNDGSSSVPTTEESSSVPTTDGSSSVPTTEESSSVPTTEESSSVSTTEESSSVPTTEESSSVPTTEESSSVPTTEESSSVPTTEESSSVPTTEESSSVPTTEESSSVPTTEESSSVPTTEESSSVPTTEESSSVSTTEESSSVPTNDGSSSVPTTEESSSVPTTDGSSSVPTTEESSSVPTTEESSSVPTTEESSSVPTTEESSSVPTTEESSSVPTTEELSSVPTTEESSSVPTTEESSSVPTTDDSSSLPTTDYSSSPPTTHDSSLPPTTDDSSSPPTTDDSSYPPTTDDSNSPPTTDDSSPPPTTNYSSSPPTTDDSSSPPTTGDSSSSPTMEDSNPAPTDSSPLPTTETPDDSSSNPTTDDSNPPLTTTTYPGPFPYPCKREGYFSIRSGEEKAKYCPRVNNPRCDFVLCSWYPFYARFYRVFYRCPQDTMAPYVNDFNFDEEKQTCVKAP